MTLAPLAPSVHIIDLRSMLHLMPDQYQALIYDAKFTGLLVGLGMGISISILTLVALRGLRL